MKIVIPVVLFLAIAAAILISSIAGIPPEPSTAQAATAAAHGENAGVGIVAVFLIGGFILMFIRK